MSEEEVKVLIASVLRSIIQSAMANGDTKVDVLDIEHALEDL